jgi:hypothetical protein
MAFAEGPEPESRMGHTCTLVGHKLYIIGGKGHDGRHIESIHILDTGSHTERVSCRVVRVVCVSYACRVVSCRVRSLKSWWVRECSGAGLGKGGSGPHAPAGLPLGLGRRRPHHRRFWRRGP